MNKKNIREVVISLLMTFLFLNSYAGLVFGQNHGVPAPNEVFIDLDGVGHEFTENYWDIISFNNSIWEVENQEWQIDNKTTWVNNYWNVKWINEGNFEMGVLSFLNKTEDNFIVTTPAQYWWMHYYYEGHEMLIGNMLSSWFGFVDSNANGAYDDGEEINPFFYFSTTIPDMHNTTIFPGLDLHPSVTMENLERTVSGNNITYTWAYNYTDMAFYVPKTERVNGNIKFTRNFDYSDPGTYVNGSAAFAVQDFVYYKYTLTLNGETNKSTLQSDYIMGDINRLWVRNEDTDEIFTRVYPGDPHYMPEHWVYCQGSWAFIMAGVDEDYELLNSDGSEINATSNNNGLTNVSAIVNGTNVFNYEFNRKKNYTIHELNNETNSSSYETLYATLSIAKDSEFVKSVSGMARLMGPFAQLMTSYAINQTNHFVNGIRIEDAWDSFDPQTSAALFVTAYPKFGQYKGGGVVHDPVFTALYTPTNVWNNNGDNNPNPVNQIPGYSLLIFVSSMIAAMYAVIRRIKIYK